jgi:hypothetical protein
VSSLAVEFEELDDWLWCLRTPVVACSAIRDRGRVVLVDASVSGQHGAILEALADRLGPEQEADVFAGQTQLAAPRLADWEPSGSRSTGP